MHESFGGNAGGYSSIDAVYIDTQKPASFALAGFYSGRVIYFLSAGLTQPDTVPATDLAESTVVS